VRDNLNLKDFDVYSAPEDIEGLLKRTEIKNEFQDIIDSFEY